METENTPVSKPVLDPKPEVFESMGNAAGAKGISVTILKQAKAKGCPGFRIGGRVEWDKVEPWILEHREELTEGDENTKAYWELFKLKADAQRSQLILEKEKGLYLAKEEVAQQLRALVAGTKATLKTTLEDSTPPKVLGKDLIGIKEVMAESV